MIRYPITANDLDNRIKKLKPTWFGRAQDVLDALSDEPKSSDFKGLWSEIKDVYIDLQHSKCAFCEKPLEGRIEQDIEHFRPKTGVDAWQPPIDLVQAGIKVKQPANGRTEPGYRLLAYHPLNYAATCKNCNTIFKQNLFPIAGTRKPDTKRPPAKSTERPYLIYPIGDADDDPEQLIEFTGCVPQPAKSPGHDRFRAQATISIFKLDDPLERRVFYQGRAKAIQSIFLNLVAIDDSGEAALVAAAKKNVRRMLQDAEPYANCLRCFSRLYAQSRAEATEVFTDLTELLDSISPT